MCSGNRRNDINRETQFQSEMFIETPPYFESIVGERSENRSESSSDMQMSASVSKTYIDIIAIAIRSSPRQMMTEQEIVKFIADNFPHCATFSLYDKVVKYLSYHNGFVKLCRDSSDGGSYHYWSMSQTSSTKSIGVPVDTELQQRQGTNVKPPYSYVTLAQIAIMSSPNQKMTREQIYEFLLHNYPNFIHCPINWRASVRQALKHGSFVELPLEIEDEDQYYSVHPNFCNESDVMFDNLNLSRPQICSKPRQELVGSYASIAQTPSNVMPSTPPKSVVHLITTKTVFTMRNSVAIPMFTTTRPFYHLSYTSEAMPHHTMLCSNRPTAFNQGQCNYRFAKDTRLSVNKHEPIYSAQCSKVHKRH